jgi:glycine amidinotransferase
MKTDSVNSHNEWDLLEEVIVGRVENAHFPSWDFIVKNTIPTEALTYYEKIFSMKGQSIPDEIINKANRDLAIFINILETEGVKVRRPELADFGKSFSTPEWSVECGVSSANPRDVFLVIGNLIIECPMADRGRYFETSPYRKILKELFHKGAKWIAAPKPVLSDDLYVTINEGDGSYSINDFEPTFDAADFVRCGKDIIGQLSHVTNKSGVKWLENTLGSDYKIHLISSKCSTALHIDTTLMPLAEGKLLINPEFVDEHNLPEVFNEWEIIKAPKPESFSTVIGNYRIVSDWMSMNVLSIDEKRVIIEEKQKGMIKTLKEYGFEPIPCPFESYYIFGGSFHCATLDIRRRQKEYPEK